jgi:hypothetical protein
MPHLARDLGHDGAAPVPVPPPMPAVMKSMSAPGDELDDALAVLLGGEAPTSGLRPRPGPWSCRAQLQRDLGEVALERLGVGVHRDELHALHAVVDHVVDGVCRRNRPHPLP